MKILMHLMRFPQVIRLKKLPNLPLSPSDPPAKVPRSELDTNWDVFIGTGARCLPGDADRCGDGGKAINARLAYPKGRQFQIISEIHWK